MKNLKRLLSLALTGVMLSGMMVMGASAANFGDADEIVNTEAVDTMVALNIINGKPDGNYDPNGLVTRAEMAKMIATAVNGGVAPEFGTKPTPTYSDIKGNWAEQYIEYCYDMKYISGRGNGTFDPAGNVTGVEAAKMVLTALGYDETAYQLKGADWAINTNAIAIRTCKPSLYENLNGVNMNVAIDRDTAAQIIWNGVQNHIVEWTPNREVTGTGLNYEYQINPNVTLLNKAYDAYIWVGTFKGNDKFGIAGLSKGEIEVYGRLEDTDNALGSAKFPAEYDIANIGEETKVIFKDGKIGGGKGEPSRGDTIYGVFNTGASEIVTGTLADVKNTKNGKAQLDIGGTKYDTDTTVDVVVNYAEGTVRTGNVLSGNGKKNLAATSTTTANSALTDDLKFATGDTVKAIIDPVADKIKTIYVTTSKIAAVTAVNSTKVSINNGVGALTIADNDIEDGLKKGDVVVVTTLYKEKATDDGAYTIVKKAETVSGEVDGYSKGDTVKVDGTNYNIHNGAALFTGIDAKKPISSFNDGTNSNNTYIGEEVTLYMVNGYVGAAEQTSESATNYSLITEVKQNATPGSAFTQLQLQVMDGEGTKTIINVSDDSDNVRDANGKLPGEADYSADTVIDEKDYKVGDIITYTMDGNEAVVTVEAPVDTATGAYSDSTKSFNGTVTSGDCVLFVQTKAGITTSNDDLWAGSPSFKAYNIRTLDGFTFTGKLTATALNHDGDKVVAAFVNLGNTPNGATSNTVYGIISANGGRVKDYYTYTVSVNGEDYTVNSKNGNLAKGDLVFFDVTADNNYGVNDITVVNGATTGVQAVYVKEYSEADKTLTFYTTVTKSGNAWVGSTASQVTLALDKDCEITYVDADADKSTAEFSVDAFDSVNGYKNAVIITKTVTVNGQAETSILAIYSEVSNKCDILSNAASKLPAGATINNIKTLADGVYTPTNKGDLATNETNFAAMRVFKFTGNDKATKYTLTIKSGDTVVYAEDSGTISADAAPTAHVFYITTDNVALNKGTTGQWKSGGTGDFVTTPDGGHLTAVAGTYTYEIKGEWTETVTAEDGTTSSAARSAVLDSGSFSI